MLLESVAIATSSFYFFAAKCYLCAFDVLQAYHEVYLI